MSQLAKRAILIVEHFRDDIWSTSLINERTEQIISRQNCRLPCLTLDSVIKDPGPSVAALGKDTLTGTIVAIAFVGNSSSSISSQNHHPFLLTSSPIPTYIISSWLAAANAVIEDVKQFILIDTTSPGKCVLLRRKDDGSLVSLGRGTDDLRHLLSMHSADATNSTDALLDTLAHHSELSNKIELINKGVSLEEIIENLSLTRAIDLVDVLATVLKPIAVAIHGLRIVADAVVVACSGDAIQVLGTTFRLGLKKALNEFEAKTETEFHYVDRPIARQVGAVRCLKPMIAGPGVWPIYSVDGLGFQLNAERPISYSIIHPTKYAFDSREDSLAQFVGSRPVLATIDKRVDELYGDSIRSYLRNRTNNVGIVLVEGQEARKSWDQVETVCAAAIDANLRRDGIMLGIGGGVTLDLVGLAAALYRRGVPYLRIPTTLIGIVDVGVGVKQGINFGKHKNILGAFYPAIGSINDPTFLGTLPERDIACGIAEIIKMGLVRDKILFELVEQNSTVLIDSKFSQPKDIARQILERAERSMMEELQPNLFEENLRRLVDFGHTFSPNIEAMSKYTIPHGEAVALDMLICTFIAVMRGMCHKNVFDRLKALYRNVRLPISQTVSTPDELNDALDSIRSHRGGSLNLVVPTGIGTAEFLQEVKYAEIHHALSCLAADGN